MVKFKDFHHPRYARENDWYGVYQNGTIICCKPTNLGQRTHHILAPGRLKDGTGGSFIDWPEDREGKPLPYVVCRSYADATKIVFELWTRSTDLMRSYAHREKLDETDYYKWYRERNPWLFKVEEEA